MTEPSLSNRIASALNGSAPSSDKVAELISDVEQSLDSTIEALTAERLRLVDPHNSDYQQTQRMVETLGIEQARLEAAHPRLQELLQTAEHRELRQALLPEFNRVVEHRNRCSETLFTLYLDFVEQFVPLLNEAIKLNADIRQMNARTRGVKLTLIPCLAEYIIEKLVLPSEQGGQDYWPDPRQANAVAVQWSEAMAQVYASPLRQAAYSPDWAAAKQADDERKIAEWTRRNELLERQQAEAKREYQKAQQRAAKGK